jgi:O-antigen/teichoic acid export membrane protein
VSAEPPNLEMAPEPPAGPMSTSRRVAINTVSNWVSMGIQLGVNVFLLAYVLKYFNEEQFGIFRLAVSISIGVAFLSFGLEASVMRLASESLAARAWDRLADILSVARTLLAAAATVGLAGVVAVSVFGLGFLKVPEADRSAAALLIQLMGLATALSLVTAVYSGALRVRQRYDLANGIVVAGTLLQAAMIVACFEGGWMRLEVLGIARLASSIVMAAAAVVLARRVLPEAGPSFMRFTRKALRDILSFGLWTAVKMVTRTTVEQAAVWVASVAFGMVAVAGLAIPQLVSQYLTQIVTGLTATLWPIAAKYAIHGERENLARLYRVGTRLTMLMLVPAAIVLVTHGRFLIGFLKPELAWSYHLMLVYVGLFLARGAVIPADHIIMASGSIRQVAISQAIAAAVGGAARAGGGRLDRLGTLRPGCRPVYAVCHPGANLPAVPNSRRDGRGVPRNVPGLHGGSPGGRGGAPGVRLAPPALLGAGEPVLDLVADGPGRGGVRRGGMAVAPQGRRTGDVAARRSPRSGGLETYGVSVDLAFLACR